MIEWNVGGYDHKSGQWREIKVWASDHPGAVVASEKLGVTAKSITPTALPPPPPTSANQLGSCPSCNADVSILAPACPRCGHPFHQSGLAAGHLKPRHTGQVVTTERTGKDLKAQGCLAALMLMAGLVTLIVGANARQEKAVLWGVLMLLVSIPWVLYVKAATWWRHG